MYYHREPREVPVDIIAYWAAQQPSRPAVIDGERVATWAEFRDRRNRLAHALSDRALGKGEHVVIYAENSQEYLLTVVAARALGAVAIPMNHRLTTEEAAYILDNSDAVAAFVSDAFVPMAERLRAGAPRVRHWILMGRERRPWALHLDDLVAAGRPAPREAIAGQGLGASMIYTAGTTGKPKGALRGAIDPAAIVERFRALDLAVPDHIHLVAGPLYHSAPIGFALYSQIFGATLVVMHKFDPEQALALIARHHCTSTFMAPTLVKRLVELPAEVLRRYDVSSLRVIVVAGAPCPMQVKEDVVRVLGPVLYEFYGSTELGINTVLRPEDALRKPGSCGRAAPGTELAILDDAGQPVPPGNPGTLYVRRTLGVFDGYYKNDAATRETIRGEWLTVGDVAWIDAEGFVYVCDRKRDMIISGGVNIYPAEIEDVLHRHPAILDAAVFGVPDDEWGERVHAAVQLRSGHTLSVQEVRDFARRHLADYKIPRDVSFVENFPRDTAGKLVKRVLREPYWRGRATRV
ncbi:MAG TPA: AMP-binding protein [Methylomirabilota bacterium]